MRPSVSIVIPAYNEEQTLAAVADRCRAVLERVSDDWEIVILDDCSTDGTPRVIAELQRRLGSHLRTLRHPDNRGIAATFEGLYKMASKDWVMLIAGDGQFPPEALLEAIELTADLDVIVCNRTKKPYGPYRHLISWGYRALPRAIFGVELFDTGSVKLVRRRIYDEIEVDSNSVFAEAERLIRAARAGFTIGKVDIEQRPRAGGRARGARIATVAHAVRDMLVLWWKLRRS